MINKSDSLNMSITTRRGDAGFSDIGGKQVHKSDLQIRLCGSLDHLNSNLGMLITVLPSDTGDIKILLNRIQRDLFTIGCICSAHRTAGRQPVKEMPDIHPIEQMIERLESQMTPLHQFILPGGHISACWAHLARTTCRTAESDFSAWISADGQDPGSLDRIPAYINRLSDFLFILARHCNILTDTEENLLEAKSKQIKPDLRIKTPDKDQS